MHRTIQEIVWECGYLKPGFYQTMRDFFRKEERITRSGPSWTLEKTQASFSLGMEHGTGKVTDSGYDQFVYVCTFLPAQQDFSLRASILVGKYPQEEIRTGQEGFGVFLRDTMKLDRKTGFPYSNMIAAGGYCGTWCMFGRDGITRNCFSDVRNLHTGQGRKITPGWYTVSVRKTENRVATCVQNAAGETVLKAQADFLKDTFCIRERNRIYLGFFAACGTEIKVDRKSVELTAEPDAFQLQGDCVLGTWPDPGSRKRIKTGKASFGERILQVAPDGSSYGEGSEKRPLDLETAIGLSADASGICLAPGHYRISKDLVLSQENSGMQKRHKRLFTAKNGKALLDFDGADAALIVEGSFWDIRGIEVTRGLGFRIRGDHNCVFGCAASYNRETGFEIRGEQIQGVWSWPSYNRIENCVSYMNRDPSGHNADGFACKVSAGKGNRFIRCLSFLNTDDGFDLFAKNIRIGSVLLQHCRSVMNGYGLDEEDVVVPTEGNGNGFKLGGCGQPVLHRVRNCIAENNKGSGFTSNSNPMMELVCCRARGNREGNCRYFFSAKRILRIRCIKGCVFEKYAEEDPSIPEELRTIMEKRTI